MKRLFYFLSILFFISCGNSKNSAEFIESVQGRYLFNSNESIEIYFEESILKVKWRGQDMTPIKASDSSFYLKEMNEKLVFVSAPEMHIELTPKREHGDEKFYFVKLKKGEKTPGEYFENGEYEKALQGYLAIKKRDSLDPTVKDWRLLDIGHEYLRKNRDEQAIEMFKINVALYSKSPRAYRNLGYAYMELKDTVNAVKNYKKALSINPDDSRALRFFEKHKLKR